LTTEEFEDLKQELADTTGVKMSEAELIELTAKIANVQSGYEDLGKVSSDTWKTLTNGTKKGTSEYRTALGNMKKTMSKVFNTDMRNITDKFVEDHIDEMEKMANGTEKEALAARDAIEDDLVAELAAADGKSATMLINAETGEAENAIAYMQTALD